jgi:hypothetical protein
MVGRVGTLGENQGTVGSLVEWEALVRAFSPHSTVEPGLKAFRRRGPKWLRMTPTFCPGWYNQSGLKGGVQPLSLGQLLVVAFSPGWENHP